MEPEHCVFSHQPLFENAIVVDAKFTSLKEWKATKQQCPVACPMDVQKAKLGDAKDSIIFLELLKGQVQAIVNKAYLDNMDNSNVTFTLHPSVLYSNGKQKKGELVLYPVGTVQLVKPEDVNKIKGVHLKFKGVDFQLIPYKALNEFNQEKAGYLVAYNWVQQTEDADKVNMVVKWQSTEGLQLPVLQNSVPLGKYDPLYKAPLTAATDKPLSKKRKTK